MEGWARLKFGGQSHRWHALAEDGSLAVCGTQDFLYERVETSQTRPAAGKLCKRCLGALGRSAKVEERKLHAAKRD